jgi:hypothetical protein
MLWHDSEHKDGSMTDIESAAPLACVPGAIPAAERATHFARLRQLFDTETQERVEVADGYSWRFLPDALDEVALFVSWERKCCPFLRFRIDVSPDSGPLWLTLDGPAGTRGFLESELGFAGTSEPS